MATLSCGMCCFDETASDCLNDRIAASRLPCIIEYCPRRSRWSEVCMDDTCQKSSRVTRVRKAHG